MSVNQQRIHNNFACLLLVLFSKFAYSTCTSRNIFGSTLLSNALIYTNLYIQQTILKHPFQLGIVLAWDGDCAII